MTRQALRNMHDHSRGCRQTGSLVSNDSSCSQRFRDSAGRGSVTWLEKPGNLLRSTGEGETQGGVDSFGR